VAVADAVKGISMFRSEKKCAVLGLVEKYVMVHSCRTPGKQILYFGKDGCKELAAKMNVSLLGQIP